MKEIAEVHSYSEVVVWNNGNVGTASSPLKTGDMELLAAHRRGEEFQARSDTNAIL